MLAAIASLHQQVNDVHHQDRSVESKRCMNHLFARMGCLNIIEPSCTLVAYNLLDSFFQGKQSALVRAAFNAGGFRSLTSSPKT